jgi:excisionase family DNA binding protein
MASGSKAGPANPGSHPNLLDDHPEKGSLTMYRISHDRRPKSTQEAQSEAPTTDGLAPLTVRIPAAVRMTGIGRSKLYELIASGDIEIVKIGASTLIPVASLQARIERNKQ